MPGLALVDHRRLGPADGAPVSLLRPRVIVLNRSTYPDAEVTRIVEAAMLGSRRHPPVVVVAMRRLGARSQVGFTPYDPVAPIDLWVDVASRYPAAGARTWREELTLSAMHEDYHFRHPDVLCPGGRCEVAAEAYAQARYRRQRRRRRALANA